MVLRSTLQSIGLTAQDLLLPLLCWREVSALPRFWSELTGHEPAPSTSFMLGLDRTLLQCFIYILLSPHALDNKSMISLCCLMLDREWSFPNCVLSAYQVFTGTSLVLALRAEYRLLIQRASLLRLQEEVRDKLVFAQLLVVAYLQLYRLNGNKIASFYKHSDVKT